MTISVTEAAEGSSDDRVFSIEDAAVLWAVSPWTVRKWIAEKKITSCKLGSRRVIPKSEIKRLINQSLVERENREPSSDDFTPSDSAS